MSFKIIGKKTSWGAMILAVSFLTFIPIYAGWNFFWGHVFFLCWIFFLFFWNFRFNEKTLLTLIFLLIYFIASLTFFSQLKSGERLYQDFFKILLLTFSILIIKSNAKEAQVRDILRHSIALFPALFLIYFLFIKTDNPFSYSGRLYDPLFGSPNVVGAFCALSAIFLIFQRELFSKLLWSILIVFYLVVLFMGFSRAAIIGLFVAILFGFRKSFSSNAVLIIVLAAVAFYFITYSNMLPEWAISKANVIEDLQETGGSGRLFIWSKTLDSITVNLPVLLFGGGPGRVIVELPYGDVEHPHNFYLFMLWGYGVFGFLGFSFYWLLSLKKAIARSRGNEEVFFSIFIFYSVVFFMDTHVLAGQFLLFHALFIAFISMGKPAEKITAH